MRVGRLLSSVCLLGWHMVSANQKPIANAASSLPLPAGRAPEYRHDLLALHKDLVEIESLTGREKNVGHFLIEYLASKGYTTTTQTLPPDERYENRERFNVLAWRGGGKDRPESRRLLVSSHIDTVPPYSPYSIDTGEVTPDTEIRGRGTVDDKASLAAQLVAVDILLENSVIEDQDFMFAFVVGEEVDGDGMRAFSHLVANMDPPLGLEAGIFGEPTVNRLACGHKGLVSCNVYAKGKDGHSGYPWLGKSANEVLIRAMAKVMETDFGSSERFGNTTVNIGVLDGGVAINVIPQEAVAKMAFRIATGPQVGGQKRIVDKLNELLQEVDPEALSSNCAYGYGAVPIDCDVEGFDTIVVNYGTDIPNFDSGKDFKRYLYGPGNIFVAHSDHEALTVGSLEKAVEDYKILIKHVLGK